MLVTSDFRPEVEMWRLLRVRRQNVAESYAECCQIEE